MSQLRLGAILSYASVGISLAMGLLYTPWIVNAIGVDDYGLYTLALSIINLFMMDFGVGTTVSRFLSKYYAEGRRDLANKFLGVAYKFYIAAACVIAVFLVVVFFFIDSIYVALNQGQLEVFKRLYVVVAAYSVISMPFLSQNNVLLSNERFAMLRGSTIFQKILTVILTILALIAGMGVFALVAVNAIVNLLMIVVKVVYVRLRTDAKADMGPASKDMSHDFVGFSGWVAISQICQRCGIPLMPTILGIVSGSAEVAMFGLACQIESYVYGVADAIGGLFLPKVSQILAQDDFKEKLTDLMVRVGRIQVYIVGLVFVGFTCYGSAFVDLWMGPTFETVYVCAVMLTVMYMVSIPQQIASTALTVSNNVKKQAVVSVLQTIVSLVSGFAAAAVFGAAGGACALMAGQILSRILYNIMYKRYLGINLKLFFSNSYFPWIWYVAALLAIGFTVQLILPCSNWFSLITEIFGFVCAYCFICWIRVFSLYEKELFLSPFKRLFHRSAH